MAIGRNQCRRSRIRDAEQVTARLTPLPATDDDHQRQRPHRCHLLFHENQFSIAPGQAAVFYADDTVLGGGLLQRDFDTNQE